MDGEELISRQPATSGGSVGSGALAQLWVFCKKLHDGFLEEWSANVPFVVLILYISQADFLSQNAQHFTYGWPDPAGG